MFVGKLDRDASMFWGNAGVTLATNINTAINSLFIGTSNELGAFESGLVANFLGPVFSVVSGGIGTIVIVLLMTWLSPDLRRFGPLRSRNPLTYNTDALPAGLAWLFHAAGTSPPPSVLIGAVTNP